MSKNSEAKGFIDYQGAMLPTEKTLRQRQNPLLQFLRFAGLNLGIMRMVAKGHDGEH